MTKYFGIWEGVTNIERILTRQGGWGVGMKSFEASNLKEMPFDTFLVIRNNGARQ